MKLLAIDLYTADLQATRLFYVRRLGLPVLEQSDTHLTVIIGWTHLTFRLVEQAVAPYHLAINVPRGSLEVLMYFFDLDCLDTQAPGKYVADFHDWQAQACYFYDNTGNLLEFIARTDLNLDNPNLTIGELFQGVSEVGIATEDVAHTSAQLQRQFGVPQFAKTTPTPDFNALGDDNGLFILAQVGRCWLFSRTAAGLNYCRIRFLNGQNNSVRELLTCQINTRPIGKPHEQPAN